LAEKICTILSRRKGRDIYDLYLLLLRGIEVNWNFVDKKLKYYQITGRKEEILQRIKNFDDKQLKNDLNQFLSIRDRKIIPVLKDLVIKQIEQSIKND
jgi:predicted nucleotidyltransferase component of viral defense system